MTRRGSGVRFPRRVLRDDERSSSGQGRSARGSLLQTDWSWVVGRFRLDDGPGNPGSGSIPLPVPPPNTCPCNRRDLPARERGTRADMPLYQNWHMDRAQTSGFVGSTPTSGTRLMASLYQPPQTSQVAPVSTGTKVWHAPSRSLREGRRAPAGSGFADRRHTSRASHPVEAGRQRPVAGPLDGLPNTSSSGHGGFSKFGATTCGPVGWGSGLIHRRSQVQVLPRRRCRGSNPRDEGRVCGTPRSLAGIGAGFDSPLVHGA